MFRLLNLSIAFFGGFPRFSGSYCFDNILNHVDSDGNNLCKNGCPLGEVTEGEKTREADVFFIIKMDT